MFYLTNILLFSGPALTLLMHSGYMLLGLSLMLLGAGVLAFNLPRQTLQNPSVYWMVGGFWLYSLIGILMVLFHGHAWTFYEMYLPAILYPLIFLVIPNSRVKPILFFLGSATGAIGAALVAIYQIKFLGISRADGFYFNAIHFGNTGLVMGAASFIGFLTMPVEKRFGLVRIWLVIGGFSGMLASLLSGSKGGWLSLVMVLIVVVVYLSKKLNLWKKVALFVISATLLGGTLTLLPKQTVLGRIESGLQGAKIWVSTGQVTEGSVSLRLAAWKIGLDMFEDRPWTGWGGKNMGPEQRQRLAQTGLESQYIGGLGAFENEYINSLVRFGILGGIGMVLAFGSPLIAFARFRKHTDPSIQGMALLGMLLPLMYMEFGLSVSVLSVNTCRQVYFSWCIVLLALILLRLRQLEKPNDQTAG